MSPAGPAPPGSPKDRLLAFLGRWELSFFVGICLAIQGLILTVAVPTFGELFREMGMTDRLPEATAALLAASGWVCRLWFVYWPAAALLSAAASLIPSRAKMYLMLALVLLTGAGAALEVYVLYLPRPVGTFRVEPSH